MHSSPFPLPFPKSHSLLTPATNVSMSCDANQSKSKSKIPFAVHPRQQQQQLIETSYEIFKMLIEFSNNKQKKNWNETKRVESSYRKPEMIDSEFNWSIEPVRGKRREGVRCGVSELRGYLWTVFCQRLLRATKWSLLCVRQARPDKSAG